MRGDRPHPLVQQVDHRAFRIGRQRAGEVLHQHERRAQAGFQVGIPGSACRIVPFVAVERTGVVHQHADWPERLRCLWQQSNTSVSFARSARTTRSAARRGQFPRRWSRLPRHWCGNAVRSRTPHRPERARSLGRCAARRLSPVRHVVWRWECLRLVTWRQSTVAPRECAINQDPAPRRWRSAVGVAATRAIGSTYAGLINERL